MKKLIISMIVLASLGSIGYAGPVESTGVQQTQNNYQPAPEGFFRDQEWNVDLFGAYAFSSTSYRGDKYLNADHAWGGGIGGDYFFHRYFGVGLEGYALDSNDVLGQFSGNFTLRLPIGNTPVAPYAYAGGGVIFNGTRADNRRFDGGFEVFRNNADAEGVGQFGGGLEVRITPHIGIMNDFSWNVINGDHNNFGMVRSGIRFAF
jgi:hypothetical protein